ncbi:unnamed protein product, partial [Gongylonema pulchrum]|uniref:E1_dh domain-containing protein n=1 Tax=Gongylonema pulchrum TaxID=637853 RepID=A0A183E7F7_9BILA
MGRFFSHLQVSKCEAVCSTTDMFGMLSSIAGAAKQHRLLAQSMRFASEATYQITKPFKLHRLDSGPSLTVTLKRDDALDMFRKMQVSRRMEMAADQLYKEKKIRGFCHLYAGEEACAVGVCAAKDDNDHIITSYRCHVWTYLTGTPVKNILSELLGKRHGNVHGKGGSMHMYGRNFYGGNGIVGAQTALGAG